MSEFGLDLPQRVKLGVDGKDGKGYLLKQTSMATILGVTTVLLVLSACLFFDIRSERTAFASDLSLHEGILQHEHRGKVTAEANLQKATAELSEQVGRGVDEESDLAIMAQHIAHVQRAVLFSVHKLIDDESLTVTDIKKVINKQFEAMMAQTEHIMHDHLVTVKDANKKSMASMQQITGMIEAELEAQEVQDRRYEADLTKRAKQSGQTNSPKADAFSEVASTVDAMFNHVYNLAQKMGDADIDSLLKPGAVQRWEKVLSDAETGAVDYDTAVKQMEAIIEEDPAALKLAEATDSFQLVHEDGDRKGVTEIGNFRNLVRHVKWLPQYKAVLQELLKYKTGTQTAQQSLLWLEQQIAAGSLDQRWLAEALKEVAPTATTNKGTASATAAAAARTTSTSTATATAATKGVAASTGKAAAAVASSTKPPVAVASGL